MRQRCAMRLISLVSDTRKPISFRSHARIFIESDGHRQKRVYGVLGLDILQATQRTRKAMKLSGKPATELYYC